MWNSKPPCGKRDNRGKPAAIKFGPRRTVLLDLASIAMAMSGVRQRLPPAQMSTAKERQALLGQRRQPTPRPLRPTRALHISISLLILACFVIYAQRQGRANPTGLYEVTGRQLPTHYAICSKEGKKIYTVPEDAGLGPVECVVVEGKEVVDTGSIGGGRPS